MGLPVSPVNHSIARRPIVGHWYSWEWCNFSVQFTHGYTRRRRCSLRREDYRKSFNDTNVHEWSFQ